MLRRRHHWGAEAPLERLAHLGEDLGREQLVQHGRRHQRLPQVQPLQQRLRLPRLTVRVGKSSGKPAENCERVSFAEVRMGRGEAQHFVLFT